MSQEVDGGKTETTHILLLSSFPINPTNLAGEMGGQKLFEAHPEGAVKATREPPQSTVGSWGRVGV
jgi:hypothetical protein